MSLFHSRASRLPIDNKKVSARRDGQAIKPAGGSVNYDADQLLASYGESDGEYTMGHAGGRTGHHSAPRKAVSGDMQNFAEDTVVDAPREKIRYTPEQKNLVRMLSHYAEPVGSFTYSQSTMHSLKKIFADKKLVNAANELQRLRDKKTALDARERARKMALEQEMAKASVAITRIVRSEGA